MKLLRRKGALERLEAQLKSGVKNTTQNGKTVPEPLTESDITRINKEIAILKQRTV